MDVDSLLYGLGKFFLITPGIRENIYGAGFSRSSEKGLYGLEDC
jgi:hypothetical protein